MTGVLMHMDIKKKSVEYQLSSHLRKLKVHLGVKQISVVDSLWGMAMLRRSNKYKETRPFIILNLPLTLGLSEGV